MAFAVIKTGGKQYIAEVGKVLTLEKIDTPEGEVVSFPFVVLYSDENTTEVGSPFLEGRKVEAKVVENGRDDKIRVLHFQSKKRMKKVKGHRQHFTKVEITSL